MQTISLGKITTLAMMTPDERNAFDRVWRPLTISEELAWNNGYIRFSADDLLDLREGVYVRRSR